MKISLKRQSKISIVKLSKPYNQLN